MFFAEKTSLASRSIGEDELYDEKYTFLRQKACQLLQITHCNKCRETMHSTTKVSSEGFCETFTATTSLMKSKSLPQEAIEIYRKIEKNLSKSGFKLTKWITSDGEVKWQIPETNRSAKVVKAEPLFIFNPLTKLECENRWSHGLSRDWARSCSK